jgi:hypothetical protein
MSIKSGAAHGRTERLPDGAASGGRRTDADRWGGLVAWPLSPSSGMIWLLTSEAIERFDVATDG